MFIEITQDDIDEANRRVKWMEFENYVRPLHCWNNPLCVALERILGEQWYAALTENWLCLANRYGKEQRIPTDGLLSVYIREWKRGASSRVSFYLSIAP